MFSVAETLGKFVWEIEQLPISELTGWSAWFRMSREKSKQR